jgi:hypothetical protein
MRLFRPTEGDDLFFGTFDDVTRPADSYLPLLEESAFCAPCHYGVFDGVAGDMTVADGVVIYNSYGEWLDSPYSDPETGRTCQPDIRIEPSRQVALAPGGNHLMLFRPKRDLVPGEMIELTFVFRDGSRRAVNFEVRTTAAP